MKEFIMYTGSTVSAGGEIEVDVSHWLNEIVRREVLVAYRGADV